MFSRRKLGKRFSLLLLEDEEDYVADWVASCKWPSSVAGNWQNLGSLPGRLRLCTKSIFFEPEDVRIPIVRLEFASVLHLEADSMQSCTVGVNKVTKMKANMADAPYVVERNKSSSWGFTLTYARLDSFMPLAQEQLVISRLPTLERLVLQDAARRSREDAAQFDSSRLVEFSEVLMWEGPAVQLSPLIREPGRLAVTDQRVYFQPLHNISGDTPVRSHPLAAVAALVRRRSSLQPVGLELFMINPSLELKQQLTGPVWDAPSAFLTFRSEADREAARAALAAQPTLGMAVSSLMPTSTLGNLNQPQHPHSQQLVAAGQLLEAAGGWLQRVMMAWQLGKVSNFDYLLYLNLAAGRSFNDLAQWPVFPWVVKDYKNAVLDLGNDSVFRDLKKPMGAQTEDRLRIFRQRYHDMESIAQHTDAAGDMPKPFMYGTHYSTPGYVMFWLVRAAPGHMLRLQAGKFDAPDRLFNSLQDSWDSATSSTTDVKELIPEFYMLGADFLVNGSQLAFGMRQNGKPVNDVVLPPWATTPENLLAKHRAALEAPYVSANLHHWIDLIFGYKQTGPAAVEADNVFYHLTYEGAVDTSKITGLQELKALETQINEFGQTPKQLFSHLHPPRLVQPPAPDPATVFSYGDTQQAAATSTGSSTHLLAAAGPPASSSSSSKPRLKGGGEDAAGGSICFALLNTILAAAAPDVQAATDDGADSQPAGSLQLSPVSSGDLVDAPTSIGGSMLLPGASAAAPPPAAMREQQQSQASGFRNMLSRLTEGAAAAAGNAAASMASAVHNTGRNSTSTTNNSNDVATAAVPPAALQGMPGVPGKANSMKVSLYWMQQQFAQGLSLNGSSSKDMAGSTSTPAPQGVSSQHPRQQLAAGQAGQPVGSYSQVNELSSPSAWPHNLPDTLRVRKSVRLQSDPLTAVAATTDGLAFCVGHNGLLRVLDTPQLSTHRSAKLDQDLLCVSLLQMAGPSWGIQSPRLGLIGTEGQPVSMPVVLAGSHAGTVLAHAPAAGRLLGSFTAHDDAVSIVLELGSSSSGRLVTASWDCSVKVWDVCEGRQPWSSTLPMPQLRLCDLESGVWAVAADSAGQLLVTGTEEGMVAAWDLRTEQQVWTAQVSSDYVGGVSLMPGGNYIAAAAADGSLNLLEWRRAGERIAGATGSSPLRCCCSDGNLLIAGTEAGQLLLWNVAQLTGQQVSPQNGSFSLAGPDGLYPAVTCPSKAAVNCLSVAVSDAGDTNGSCTVWAALDDGMLVVFSN